MGIAAPQPGLTERCSPPVCSAGLPADSQAVHRHHAAPPLPAAPPAPSAPGCLHQHCQGEEWCRPPGTGHPNVAGPGPHSPGDDELHHNVGSAELLSLQRDGMGRALRLLHDTGTPISSNPCPEPSHVPCAMILSYVPMNLLSQRSHTNSIQSPTILSCPLCLALPP